VPIQFIIWWIVIRRCGKLEIVEFTEWDDDQILFGGTDLSLFQFMRASVKKFLENKHIEKLILVMTLFLCGVIFTELSMPEDILSDPETKDYTELGYIFFLINYALLTFFIIEICLKLFVYGHLFLMEFINVFDSLVVIISFVFYVLNLKVNFVGILRVMRLIKVITEMKRVADIKKAKQEAIKK
jgi:hypothetical protein